MTERDKVTAPELPDGMFFRVTGEWSFDSATVQIREQRRFGSRMVVEVAIDWATARHFTAERAVRDAMLRAVDRMERQEDHRLAARALDKLVGDYGKEGL